MTIVEIANFETDEIVVCDTLAHILSCDDGLRDDEASIVSALARGEEYIIGGGAAGAYVLRLAPAGTIVTP